MKLLLAAPSPRNIKEVQDEWDKINEDMLIVKHYQEYDAYQIIRNFFLEHTEYTHLAICPDDLIVTQKDVNILKRDIKKHDYAVITGLCNVEHGDDSCYNVIVSDLPNLIHRQRSWRGFAKEGELTETITKVLFAGFALEIIRRDVIEMIDFDSESKLQGGDPNHIGNLDLIFSYKCFEKCIPIYCDKRAKMVHLRRGGAVINKDPNVRRIIYKSGGMLHNIQGPPGN